MRCEAARLLASVRDFFWSRKEGMLGDFSGAENRACWAIFLGAENQQRQ